MIEKVLEAQLKLLRMQAKAKGMCDRIEAKMRELEAYEAALGVDLGEAKRILARWYIELGCGGEGE